MIRDLDGLGRDVARESTGSRISENRGREKGSSEEFARARRLDEQRRLLEELSRNQTRNHGGEDVSGPRPKAGVPARDRARHAEPAARAVADSGQSRTVADRGRASEKDHPPRAKARPAEVHIDSRATSTTVPRTFIQEDQRLTKKIERLEKKGNPAREHELAQAREERRRLRASRPPANSASRPTVPRERKSRDSAQPKGQQEKSWQERAAKSQGRDESHRARQREVRERNMNPAERWEQSRGRTMGQEQAPGRRAPQEEKAPAESLRTSQPPAPTVVQVGSREAKSQGRDESHRARQREVRERNMNPAERWEQSRGRTMGQEQAPGRRAPQEEKAPAESLRTSQPPAPTVVQVGSVEGAETTRIAKLKVLEERVVNRLASREKEDAHGNLGYDRGEAYLRIERLRKDQRPSEETRQAIESERERARGAQEARREPWDARRVTGHRQEYNWRRRDQRRFQERQERLLVDVGVFRSVAVRDAAAVHFDGHPFVTRRAIVELADRGLIKEHTAAGPQGGEFKVLSVTPAGAAVARQLAPRRGYRPSQAIWSGVGHRREVRHDAAIFRAAASSARRLRSAGADVTRVRLDAELKRGVARRSETARAAGGPAAAEEWRRQAAQELGLPIAADGHVVYPDAQLEYTDAGGEAGRVNIEVASEHYRQGTVADKVAAGFEIHASKGRAASNVRRLIKAISGQSPRHGGRRAGRGEEVFEL